MASSKIKLLRILEIIRETDEEHPYTANQIVQKLSLYGIEAERKSVLRDISTLKDAGFDILLHPDNKLGYYLAGRDFEDWELKILMDAALGATFLTPENSWKIAEKLSRLSGLAGGRTLRAVTPLPTAVKIGDPTTKNAIDLLLGAIRRDRAVEFRYITVGVDLQPHYRYEGMLYPVSPYALVWRQDRYYLIGAFEKYKKLSYYRLDRIRDMTVTEKARIPMESILGPNTDLLLRKFVDRNLYNHGGRATHVRLSASPEAVDLLIDTFGREMTVTERADSTLDVTAKVSDGLGLNLWLLQHGDLVQIIEPESIRQQVISMAETVRKKYGLSEEEGGTK